MMKKILTGLIVIGSLASCSSVKPLNFTSNKPVAASAGSSGTVSNTNKEVKFLEDISVETGVSSKKHTIADRTTGADAGPNMTAHLAGSSSLEKASELQLKYAILLNTEVEQLQDNKLIGFVDEWYGTRYRYGGTTKSGIDCSAFVQAIYLSAFAVNLPRTAREQYRNARIVSATEMKCGDLVFFNTTGGISHVGIYLQNNKFVHASTAYGVTISDMFDPYYLKRFIGIGRVEKPEVKIR